MIRESKQLTSYPGDMTLWMIEDHPRYDYHLLQFRKRYEIQCNALMDSPYCSVKEKDKSKEFAFI